MNKKLVISIVALALVVAVFGTAGSVFAQAPAPLNGSGNAYGAGARGTRGAGMGMGVNGAAAGTQTGWMHEDMAAVYAEALGISVDELNARLAGGETLSQIAASSGLTAEQFTELMAQAHTQALDQAVQDGTLAQEQADWMSQRGAGMSAGGRGMRGAGDGTGLYADPDCPYYE